MDKLCLENMFEGLTAETIAFLTHDGDLLTAAISELSKVTAVIAPRHNDIFNAFRLCPIESARVCIIGQDPYPGKDKSGNPVADGLSFSTPRHIKVQASARTIYGCLAHNALISDIPTHGDLSGWAKQGVLMLNAYLTTELGKPNQHKKIWEKYTSSIIARLKQAGIIFIALGKPAQALVNSADTLSWGHPSSLNRANSDRENPANFLYATVFSRANELLVKQGFPAINWDPNYVARDTLEKEVEFRNSVNEEREKSQIYAFTDGAASANGSANCRASWAYFITNVTGSVAIRGADIVANKEILGEKYTASNNRGELFGIYNALLRLNTEFGERGILRGTQDRATLVSDSQYSISCITDWGPKWLAAPEKNKLSEKKNMDIIDPAIKILAELRKKITVVFTHIRSHKKAPADRKSIDYFMWLGNDTADKLCTSTLKDAT